MQSPWAMITARAIAFSSSRIFPWPVVVHQAGHGARVDVLDRLPVVACKLLAEEMVGEKRYVFSGLCRFSAGTAICITVDAEIKIAAELAFLHHLSEIAVRRE